MKYSTSKGSRVKHSTGVNLAKLENIRRRVKSLKHSTGGHSSLAHSTGKETDCKGLYDQLIEKEEKEIEEERVEKNKEK